MTEHLGRLVDHVHLRVRDLAASRRFYAATLEAIGRLELLADGEGCFSADELYVEVAHGPVSRVHLAFQARERSQVDRFHAAALAAGGVDNGGPGLRGYHAGYYAAFVLDPDGNNIEVVHHGDVDRSAESVTIDRRAAG